jgi:hypothetical protein
MRNTRTAAACLAATTLFGLLSATPALASELDRGDAAIVQGQESSGSGLGLLGRSAADAPVGQSDRGDAGMAPSQQAGGPDVRTPGRPLPAAATEAAPATEPAQPAPEAATPAQSSSVDVTLVRDGAVVSLPEDLYRSDKRIVVIVEGKPVAQIQNQQTRGAIFSTTHADGDPVTFLIPDVKSGDRMAVTEYVGTLDSGFDDSLRRQRLFAAQLSEPAPAEPVAPASLPVTPAPAPAAPAAPVDAAAPTASPAPVAAATPATPPASAGESTPSKGAPLVSASYGNHRAVVLLSKELVSASTRVKIWVNGVETASALNGMNGLSSGIWSAYYEGDRLQLEVLAEPGDQVKVTAVDVDGSGADRSGTQRDLFEGLMQSAGAPLVSASYGNHRAVVLLSKELVSASTRVKIWVNGVETASALNGMNVLSSGIWSAYYEGDRLQLEVLAEPGDQVKVTAVDVDGSGADQSGTQRDLFEKKI